MLRKLFLLLVVCSVSTFVNAQDKTDPIKPDVFIGHEVILGHGILPANQLFASLGPADYSNSTATGAISLTYRYHISRVISVGLAAMYEHEDGTWRTGTGLLLSIFGGSYQFYGNFSRTCITIAPEVTFNYGDVADGMLRFYGMFGAGFTFKQQNAYLTGSNDPNFSIEGTVPRFAPMHLNMQLTPFGMRYGKALGGFVELGCGYKGIFNYGITYRFR